MRFPREDNIFREKRFSAEQELEAHQLVVEWEEDLQDAKAALPSQILQLEKSPQTEMDKDMQQVAARIGSTVAHTNQNLRS